MTIALIDGLIIRDGAKPSGRGGGVYVHPFDYLTLSDCLVTGNRAAIGGGVGVYFGGLTLVNSSVVNNTSSGVEGAAGVDAFDARYLHIFNSTVAGNVANDGVGGVIMQQGEPLIVNSTITDNRSLGTGFGRVGGVASYGFGASGGMYNSIVARNAGQIPDLQGIFPSHSLISNGDGAGPIGGVNGNLVGTTLNPVNPMLGPLTDNGGGIPTFALLAASPARNAGSNLLYAEYDWLLNRRDVDQRGFGRFFDQIIDMGSVEYGSSDVSDGSVILGRITTGNGRGIFGARVTVRIAEGETRMAITNSSGYYRINGVPVDVAVTVEAVHKRANFQPQAFMVEEDREYVDFVSM